MAVCVASGFQDFLIFLGPGGQIPSYRADGVMLVIRRLIVVVGTLLVGSLGTVLAFPAAAVATAGKAGPIAVSPALVRPLFAAASTPASSTVTASYTCDFSKYENTANPTIPAATGVKFDVEVETSWPVNIAQDVPLGNEAAIALPDAVSSQLTGVDDFSVTASAATKNASTTSIAFSGDSPVSSTSAPTEVPQVVASGQVTFPKKGTGGVELPAQTITITPLAAATTKIPKAKPAITCSTTQAATDVPVTVGAASGPFYTCLTTVGFGGFSTSTDSGTIDMTLTATGTQQVGQTVTVTLSSDGIAALTDALGSALTQLNSAQPAQAAFTFSLAVSGAQSGTLTVPATLTDLTATSFSASASLKLTKAGTVNVDIPQTWSLDLFAGTTAGIDVVCTLVTRPAPVGVAMTVTAASGTPSPSASSSASGSGGEGNDNTAAPEGSGVPSGGAATGGGPVPGGDVPLAMAGVALFLTGGGLVLRAVAPRGRRRPKSGAL
jgi:hypothetical protein